MNVEFATNIVMYLLTARFSIASGKNPLNTVCNERNKTNLELFGGNQSTVRC